MDLVIKLNGNGSRHNNDRQYSSSKIIVVFGTERRDEEGGSLMGKSSFSKGFSPTCSGTRFRTENPEGF